MELWNCFQSYSCNRTETLPEVDRRGFANIAAEMFDERGRVIGENPRVVRWPRYGDTRKARVDELRVNLSIHVDQHTFCCQPLRAVRGNGIAVIEVAMFRGVELDLPVAIKPHSNAAIRRNGFDNGKVAVGDGKRLVRRGELNTVRLREFLTHNGHPHTYVDLDSDTDAQELLDRFNLKIDEIPVVLCSGTST
jgi:hypothetical protein